MTWLLTAKNKGVSFARIWREYDLCCTRVDSKVWKIKCQMRFINVTYEYMVGINSTIIIKFFFDYSKYHLLSKRRISFFTGWVKLSLGSIARVRDRVKDEKGRIFFHKIRDKSFSQKYCSQSYYVKLVGVKYNYDRA